MKADKQNSRSAQQIRQVRLNLIEGLLGRGAKSLDDGSMKVTIADYLRLLGKELETAPPEPSSRKTIWLDDLDSLPDQEVPDLAPRA